MGIKENSEFQWYGRCRLKKTDLVGKRRRWKSIAQWLQLIHKRLKGNNLKEVEGMTDSHRGGETGKLQGVER